MDYFFRYLHDVFKKAGGSWHHVAAAALLFAVSFFLYYNTLDNDFVYDDLYIIKMNPHIRPLGQHFTEFGPDGKTKKSFLKKSSEYFTNYRSTAASIEWTSVYRPLRQFSLALDYGMAEKEQPVCEGHPEDHEFEAGVEECPEDGNVVLYADPQPFHFMNIVYHAFAAITFYFLLGLFVKNPLAMFAGAFLFVAHPVQGVSLSFVSAGRDMMFQTAFFMLTLLCIYRAWQVESESRRTFYHRLALVFFALALFAKISSIILPVAGIALIWLVVAPCRKEDRFRGKAFAATILILVLPFIMLMSFVFIGLGFWYAIFAAPVTLGAVMAAWILVNRYHGRNVLGNAARLVDFGVVFGGYYLIRQAALQQSLSLPTEYVWQNFGVVLKQMFASIAHYLRIIFVPSGLTTDHSNWDTYLNNQLWPSYGWLIVIAVLVFFGLMVFSFFYSRRVAFGMYLFFLGLLMVINVNPVAQKISEWSMYLPMAGMGIIFAVGIEKALRWLGVFASDEMIKAGDRAGFMLRHARGISFVIVTVFLVVLLIPWSSVVWANNGKWKDGVSFWEDNWEKLPYNANAPLNLGIYYGKKYSDSKDEKDIDTAIKYLSKVLEKNDKNADAYCNIGTAYSRKGDDMRALEYYKQALKIDPAHKDTLLNAANLFRKQGNFSEASVYYRDLIMLENQRMQAGREPNRMVLFYSYQYLGEIMFAQKKLTEAVELANLALQMQPYSYETQILLARSYQMLGQTDSAEQLLASLSEKVRNRSTSMYADVQFYRGLGAEMAKANDQAEKFYLDALNAEPGYMPAHQNLGRLFATNKKYAEAEKHFELAKDDNNPETCLNLANTWFSIGKTDNNLGMLQKAIGLMRTTMQKFPDYMPVYHFLGQYYMDLGKWEETVSISESAVQRINLQLNYNPMLQSDQRLAREKRIEMAYYAFRAAVAYAGLKNREKTLEQLKSAISNGFVNWEMIANERNFDWIRSDPAFRAALEGEPVVEEKK